MIRHLVLFNLKDSASEEDLATVVRAAQQLLTRIPGVVNLAVSQSLNTHSQSPFRHALTMEFADEAALATYIDHPLHQEFRGLFAPRRDNVQSMDFIELPQQG